jgi:FtsZ-binding cell division protein ZapB
LEIASSRLRRGIAQFAILNLQFAIGICAQAQGNSSLSESKNESAAHPATAEALLQENEQLQKQLSIAQESLKALTSSLSESNADAASSAAVFVGIANGTLGSSANRTV